MKKSFTLVLLLLFSITSFAQLSWNAKVGLNLSNWIGKDAEGTNVKPGIRMGVGMEYAFNDVFALQPSLFFSQKGTKGSEKEDYFGLTVAADAKCNQLYLELPINAQVRFKITDHINITVCAGPYIAYGVGGKLKSKIKIYDETVEVQTNTFGSIDKVTVTMNGESQDIPAEDYTDENAPDGLKRFDAGMGVGVGLEYKAFLFNIDSQFGCAKLSKDVSARNMNVGITVGYKF